MCGIIGVAGEIGPKSEKVLRMLLLLDSLRGEDSTGAAFVVKYTGATHVAKALGDPFNLFNDNKFNSAMNRVNRVIIGHNRYATSGGVAKSSAHPFDFDTLVGVHNGTLSSKYKLLDAADFKVDSQNLYHHIEQKGLRDAIDHLSSPNNAWSLVWWDKVKEGLNFLRNKERPMFMCMDVDKKTLYWASEAWMLYAALGREGIRHTAIEETQEDCHYIFPIDNKGVIGKPKLAYMAAPEYVPPVNNNWNNKPQHIPHTPAAKEEIKSNVVALTKAVVEAQQVKKPEGQGSLFETSYLGTKNVKLEILAKHFDSNGGQYLSLFDPKHQRYQIRVYPQKGDDFLFDCMGRDITGDISNSAECTDKFSTAAYYKVVPASVELVPEPEDKAMDHRGKLIPVAQWISTYSNCEWCSENLDPNRANRFTTSGQCVCAGCSKDPEVIQYVNLI